MRAPAASASSATWSPPESHRRLEATWVAQLLGLASGLGFTGVIVLSLAWFSRPPEAPDDAPLEEVRAVALPEPPPPPPQTLSAGTPLPPAPMVFEDAPSTSSVRIAPTPIPIAPLVTENRPNFSLRFDFNPGEFRPGGDDWEPDVNHVFQRSEVDQQVVAIFRKTPRIPTSLLREVENPRVTVLFIVNTDGSVQDVRLLRGQHPEFDALIVEAIREWRFRPATRKGKKVRCLTELPVHVKAPAYNPFSTN